MQPISVSELVWTQTSSAPLSRSRHGETSPQSSTSPVLIVSCVSRSISSGRSQKLTEDPGSTRPSTAQISESDEITDEEDAMTPVPRPRPQHLKPRAAAIATAAQPLRLISTRRMQRQLFPPSSTPGTEIPITDLTSLEGPAAATVKRKAGEAELEDADVEAEAEAGLRKRHLTDFFG